MNAGLQAALDPARAIDPWQAKTDLRAIFPRVDGRALLSVCELIDWPLRDPARPGEWGVSRRYVHRIADEWRKRYRRAFGRKGYILTLQQLGPRRLRLVVRAPGVAL